MYSSHHSLVGCLSDLNANSTCCLHSWHEKTFVQLANKKTPSSLNILLIGTHSQKLKLNPIHFKMLSLFPPLVGWHKAGCKPCTNMNIFRISKLLGVYHIWFSFYMLQITAPIVVTSYLLCAYGDGGKTFCKNETPQKMWYIWRYPHVVYSMQGVALASQSCIFFFSYSFIFWALLSFLVAFRPMTILFRSWCSTYSNINSNFSSTIVQLWTQLTHKVMEFLNILATLI